jgi:hypothetical protein
MVDNATGGSHVSLARTRRVVLGDRELHVDRLPAPGGLSTEIQPPSSSTRSLSPSRPEPRAKVAPPPLSRTDSRRRPSTVSTPTATEEASACLATFVSASETT